MVASSVVVVENHPVEARENRVVTRQTPRLGCAGIVRRGDAVLLGLRNKEPNLGMWVLPGGGIEFGEKFADTLRRKLAEEASIEIDVDDEAVFNVYELVNPPQRTPRDRLFICAASIRRANRF